MPRIKLKECQFYEFKYNKMLLASDINYGGHLGNDRLVTILHDARLYFLKELNFTELDLGDGKTGIIMQDLAVNYKKEGQLYDNLTILSHIDEFTNFSFRIFHKIIRNDDLIALAETGMVTFDYDSHSMIEVPEIFINSYHSYLKMQNNEINFN